MPYNNTLKLPCLVYEESNFKALYLSRLKELMSDSWYRVDFDQSTLVHELIDLNAHPICFYDVLSNGI